MQLIGVQTVCIYLILFVLCERKKKKEEEEEEEGKKEEEEQNWNFRVQFSQL